MKSDFDFGFWEEKIRFLGVKNRNLGSLEKGNKSDFDLAFRIHGVKSRKNQISWSEKSKFEKKKSDFDLTPGVKSWIWVLRRKNQISWSGKSKFGFWEEGKYDFDLIYQQYNKSKNITKVKKSNNTTNVQKYHRYKKYHKSKNSTSHKIPQKSKYTTKSKRTTITQKIQRKPNNTTKHQKSQTTVKKYYKNPKISLESKNTDNTTKAQK